LLLVAGRAVAAFCKPLEVLDILLGAVAAVLVVIEPDQQALREVLAIPLQSVVVAASHQTAVILHGRE
jgi:hypothetical protein